MEKSTNTLPFLDMELKIHNNNLQSWIWRKPTHTGVFLNFKAIFTSKWKSNLISCMLNCAKNICSDCHLFKNEVETSNQCSVIMDIQIIFSMKFFTTL